MPFGILEFYRKMLKIIFEAYTVWNHVWKLHCPVTNYKNSTAVTNLTAATSGAFGHPWIRFCRKMCENLIAMWHVTADINSTVSKMLAAIYILLYYLVNCPVL